MRWLATDANWERRPWDGEDGGRKFAQEHDGGLFAKGAAAELPALGLDRRLRLAVSSNDQGEAGFCELGKPKKHVTDAASSWKSVL